MSDSTLQVIHACFQWSSIVGILLGLLTAVGMIFTGSIISARADSKLTAANKQILHLDERTRVRKINGDSRKRFIEAMNNAPKIVVSVNVFLQGGLDEPMQLARQISDMLNDCGMQSMADTIPLGDPIAPGIELHYDKEKEDQSEFAKLVKFAFSEIDISVRFHDTLYNGEDIVILVGSKPE